MSGAVAKSRPILSDIDLRGEKVEVHVAQGGTSREVGGRGAYLCRRMECFETAIERGSLERSLKGSGTKDSQAELLAWASKEFTSPSGV